MCITVSRCGSCFGNGWPYATKCEDGKAYVEKFEEVSEVQTPHQMRCIAFLSRTKVGATPLQPRTRSARTLGTINLRKCTHLYVNRIF